MTSGEPQQRRSRCQGAAGEREAHLGIEFFFFSFLFDFLIFLLLYFFFSNSFNASKSKGPL